MAWGTLWTETKVRGIARANSPFTQLLCAVWQLGCSVQTQDDQLHRWCKHLDKKNKLALVGVSENNFTRPLLRHLFYWLSSLSVLFNGLSGPRAGSVLWALSLPIGLVMREDLWWWFWYEGLKAFSAAKKWTPLLKLSLLTRILFLTDLVLGSPWLVKIILSDRDLMNSLPPFSTQSCVLCFSTCLCPNQKNPADL